MPKLYIIELDGRGQMRTQGTQGTLRYTNDYGKIGKGRLLGTISGLEVYRIVRRLKLEEIR